MQDILYFAGISPPNKKVLISGQSKQHVLFHCSEKPSMICVCVHIYFALLCCLINYNTSICDVFQTFTLTDNRIMCHGVILLKQQCSKSVNEMEVFGFSLLPAQCNLLIARSYKSQLALYSTSPLVPRTAQRKTTCDPITAIAVV